MSWKYEDAGMSIGSAIEKLKKVPFPYDASMPIEFYLLDDDYDVKVMVRLIPKKSQEERGYEVFGKKKK